MIDLTGVEHHPVIEEIVDVLCSKTDNTDRGFFRTEMAYYLGKMASCMRATVVTEDRGENPVNIYAVALATSGYGKGHSVNIIEDGLMKGFKRRFMQDTMPVLSDTNFWAIANDRALRNNSDPQEEYDKVLKEYRSAGSFPFTFDDGTVAAVKQLRQKLILAGVGAINFQVDEIGSNLERSMEMLNLYLELYDQGLVKNKLIKNTNDNQRAEEVDGKTPSNMLLFGTPAKLFDGGKTEDAFYSLLETGYARRCLFGYGQKDKRVRGTQSPAEIYQHLINPKNNAAVTKWATHFETLADPARYGWRMNVEQPVAIQLLTYKIDCENRSDELRESQTIQKAELEHRYNKALKLAGAYAFVDGSNEVEMDHLMQAILLVEESGQSFQKILHREKPHVRLGKYIADIGTEVNDHDLIEALPFYPKSQNVRNDMLKLATAWGYTNNVIIKKLFVDGIEFYKGETLKVTDLSKIRISYSDHWAYNYEPEEVPFDALHQLTQAPGMHWANHHFKQNHRAEENVLSGFNLLVLDVDGGISCDMAHELLKEVKFMTYTTKRSTPQENRFRLLIPTNYVLELDKEEYKELVNDVVTWLPFKASVDESSNQRSKKWMTFEGGTFHYNMDGALFDILPFIPKTKKNEDYHQEFKKVENLDNLERWFAQRIANGNRNNNMIKFALALVDGGSDFLTVSRQVHAFNKKLNTPMDEEEIDNTILVTVAKRFQKHAA